MTPNENFVGHRESHLQELLCDGCDVTVRLSDSRHEKILIAGQQLLDRDDAVYLQYPGDEITTFGDRSGTEQQHPKWIARALIIHLGTVSLYYAVRFETLDALSDGAVRGTRSFRDVSRRHISSVLL